MNSQLFLSTKLTTDGTTRLDEYFVSPPFKLMTLPVYDDAWRHGLNAMQMSSSPGLLGGDRLEIRISLAKSTALSLKTQAFTRVQAMNGDSHAEQITVVKLAPNSRFFYLPHPLVLHKDSALKQKTIIEMDDNAGLIYGEIVAIGRVMNGERFQFRQFSSHVKIYRLQENGVKRPLLSDCIQWKPSVTELTALSQMENYSHQGSLCFIHVGKSAVEIKEILTALQQQFTPQADILAGLSQLNESGIIIRILAHKAEDIQNYFERIGAYLKERF